MKIWMFQTDDGVGEKDKEEEEEWFVMCIGHCMPQRQPVKRSRISTFFCANLYKKAQSLLQQGFWLPLATGVDPQVFVKLAAPSSGQIYVQHFATRCCWFTPACLDKETLIFSCLP